MKNYKYKGDPVANRVSWDFSLIFVLFFSKFLKTIKKILINFQSGAVKVYQVLKWWWEVNKIRSLFFGFRIENPAFFEKLFEI